MAELEKFKIRPYQKGDNKHPFVCGIAELDRYFHRTLSQDIKRNQAAGYILWDNSKEAIAGYFTISAIHISLSEIPEEYRKKLPYNEVPFLLLGRLAVDEKYQGRSLGKTLLMSAFQLASQLKNQVGAWGLAVDPIDQPAKEFYSRFDFQELHHERRMFISMQTILQIFPS